MAHCECPDCKDSDCPNSKDQMEWRESVIPSTDLLALKERAELAEATLERLALDATDGYLGGAQRLVIEWMRVTKANKEVSIER